MPWFLCSAHSLCMPCKWERLMIRPYPKFLDFILIYGQIFGKKWNLGKKKKLSPYFFIVFKLLILISRIKTN